MALTQARRWPAHSAYAICWIPHRRRSTRAATFAPRSSAGDADELARIRDNCSQIIGTASCASATSIPHTKQQSLNISVCIATSRRPDRLAALLGDLVRQRLLPTEVAVVDNDARGSARVVVERRRDWGAPFPIYYDIQPDPGLSLTCKRSIALVNGDWLAFIGDDKRAPEDWLQRLVQAALGLDADGVIGPVRSDLPDYAPAWIQRGGFYDRTSMATGTVISAGGLRFGTMLLKGALLEHLESPIVAGHDTTGLVDHGLLNRLVREGARLVWCDEAVVGETVEGSKLSLRWLLQRAMRDGSDFARRLEGHPDLSSVISRCALLPVAMLRSITAATLSILSLPRGRHHAARWLIDATAQVGRISTLLPARAITLASVTKPDVHRGVTPARSESPREAPRRRRPLGRPSCGDDQATVGRTPS